MLRTDKVQYRATLYSDTEHSRKPGSREELDMKALHVLMACDVSWTPDPNTSNKMHLRTA